jgi:hypothetical protein
VTEASEALWGIIFFLVTFIMAGVGMLLGAKRRSKGTMMPIHHYWTSHQDFKQEQEQHPDIIATIQFRTTAEGGRKGPTPKDMFRCPFIFGQEAFDCGLHLNEVGAVHPGQTVIEGGR